MVKYITILLCVLLSTHILAQDDIHVLRIKADLVDDNGDNLSDVNITINGEIYKVASRKWTYDFLKDSVYHISFSKKGYMGKTLVFNTYNSDEENHFFNFDMILSEIELDREVVFHKVISQIVFNQYKRDFEYNKSMAIKRQREIYNCKLL